jgi:ribonuclease BN (tRNA processing enzyme)
MIAIVFSANFLGVGAAHATELGNASLVIEKDGEPWLLIDCGFDTLNRYKTRYGNQLPAALFITHCHFDHIGGLEQLYFQARLRGVRPTIYLPHLLVPMVVSVLENTLIAEGNENLWDSFHLVPVLNTFCHQATRLHVYPVRHHQPNSAFSLHMPGYFFYSGDTRPIPELLHHHVNNREVIFHDCSIVGNPSHTGLDDLLKEYSVEVLTRIVVYHYACNEDSIRFAKHNLACAKPDEIIHLPTNIQQNVNDFHLKSLSQVDG